MESAIHKNLASGHWFELTLAEQLGNIGSEVGRALASQKNGDEQRKKDAVDRALELTDLTISDARWMPRLKELTRGREVLADWFYGDNVYSSAPENLEKYYYYFAYSARRGK
ncbi:MAG: hypothetical protein AAB390_03840 [Patescibacteria group bacterium]